MTQHPDTLANRLLAYHVTVRFPTIDAASERPRTLSRRMLVFTHMIGLRSALAAAGHRHFLYRLHDGGEGGWRIDLFLPNEKAVQLVVENTHGIVERGDNSSSMGEFVEDRIYELGWAE